MIASLWFLLAPTESSELADVAVLATWSGLAAMFRGGLSPDDLLGAVQDADQAIAWGEKLLQWRDEWGAREARRMFDSYMASELLAASTGGSRR